MPSSWAMLLLHTGIFFSNLLLGSAAFGSYQENNNGTVPLTVSLPSGSSSGLLWQDLSVMTPSSQCLLRSSSGFVENGHICGILGPSGAGKTTFLSTIAGRPEASLHVNGQVLHYQLDNGHSNNNNNDNNYNYKCAPVQSGGVAWLQQHDAFFERLTVKETLDLAVFLELPHLSWTQRDQVARSCLDSLGLSPLQDRPVGSPKASRVLDGATLSGGEMRRLSVAVELVTMPHLFIADEPTSGIDSKMSENVMAAIASLARERQIPCFCTLHQPRSSIWHMLDAVILMAPGGRICYAGPREDVLGYLSSVGYDCPSLTNPAEFVVDLVSVDPENVEQAAKDSKRIEELAATFARYTKEQQSTNGGTTCTIVSDDSLPVSKAQQQTSSVVEIDDTKQRHPFRAVRRFGALFRRSWRQNIRSTFLNAFRLLISTGTALMLSQIFPSIAKGEPPQPKSVVDRVALLSFGVINMMMTAVMKTLDVFAKEKPIVQREKNRNLYSSLEYLLSKSVAEIPLDVTFAVVFTATLKATTGLAISWSNLTATFSLMTVAGASLGLLIGSFTSSQEAAVSTGIPIVIIMMIVGIINPSGVDPTIEKPLLIQSIKTFSPIATAIEALALAEFSGMEFEQQKSFLGWRKIRDVSRVGGVALVKNGDEVLDALGLRDADYPGVMRHMTALSLLNFGLCWLFLGFSDTAWFGRLKQLYKATFSGRGARGVTTSTKDECAPDPIETVNRHTMTVTQQIKPKRVAVNARV
ncbi:Putative white-brown complex homolog protein 30 [Seminavis robusta]|uniref:White-brown complex homolog protein 30 n=1 Tax=Seminavis robusta TaxID=568900 RepID=A0A9N8HWC5_9STRA|nr:Putative white-brown complex homolog protein 30 [Seminavis robusta]|eukprot:Sro2145_g316370.1 Putative white-brown complex homolog protein 30 (752) ;mRNA; f:10900-13448